MKSILIIKINLSLNNFENIDLIQISSSPASPALLTLPLNQNLSKIVKTSSPKTFKKFLNPLLSEAFASEVKRVGLKNPFRNSSYFIKSVVTRPHSWFHYLNVTPLPAWMQTNFSIQSKIFFFLVTMIRLVKRPFEPFLSFNLSFEHKKL